MIDPEKLAAFALVTGLTSVVPGPSMVFVLGQAAWRGPRAGAAALAGLQLGYIVWWVLAALGLGALAAAFPLAFRLLAIAGAFYLAWLGVQAWREARRIELDADAPVRQPTARAMSGGIAVALSNPKALIYVVALLPPFVDAGSPVVPQLVVLAMVAMAIDVALGTVYILAGGKLAAAMTRPVLRRRVDRAIGTIFILIAAGVLAELAWR